MIDIYRKLFDILNSRERAIALFLGLLLLAVGAFEVVGVASIMPFMTVLANPGVVETNTYLAWIYEALEFQSQEEFLFFLGMMFLALMISALGLGAVALWAQVRFSQGRNHAWSCRLVQRYLERPYEWYLQQHSSTLGSSVLTEVQRTVNGALFPALQLFSQGVVATFLLGLMVVVAPWVALTVGAGLAVAYSVLFITVRRFLGRLGNEIQSSNRQRFLIAQEMFGGIKDVKVYGLESPFLERYRDPSSRFARRNAAAQVIAELPSFAMQALVFGGIMSVLLYFLSERGGLQGALPVFSLYAMAGYRLMPALQTVYRQLAQLKVNSAVLDAVHGGLTEAVDPLRMGSHEQSQANMVGMGLRQSLELVDITYRYPGSDQPVLRGINMSIPALSTVGLVGATGSGKTTLVDVILGVLAPTAGVLRVDGESITPAQRRSWQRSIGYVPQHIFLVDDTVEANIAFGIPPNQVDRQAVERAARIANLHDFVVGNLEHGYDTLVGERGVRLSGGQRQRIGIARALYRDPDVLILDEATSALDNLTEKAVMEAVHNLGNRKTIILIAHRLSTVRQCNQIFYLEGGLVTGQGTYDELVDGHPEFRRLAGAGG